MHGYTFAFILATIGLLSSAVSACYPPDTCICETDPDSLQCLLCGNPDSSGITCTAYNATFDDLTTKQVSPYNGSTYTGFTAVTAGPQNPIMPSSKKKLIRAVCDMEASITFTSGGGVGSMYYFDYGCGKPYGKTSSHEAVACNISITVATVDLSQSDTVGYYSGMITYEPSVKHDAPMRTLDFQSSVVAGAVVSPTGGQYSPGGLDVNFTFVATQADGSPAFLYMDNIVSAQLCIGCGP